MGLGIMGWRRVGLGICEVGGVGSGSNLAPWIFCSEEHLSMGGTENVILFSHLTVVISLSNPPPSQESHENSIMEFFFCFLSKSECKKYICGTLPFTAREVNPTMTTSAAEKPGNGKKGQYY